MDLENRTDKFIGGRGIIPRILKIDPSKDAAYRKLIEDWRIEKLHLLPEMEEGFMERSEVTTQIKKCLLTKGQVMINGKNGVGKSSIATYYAHQHSGAYGFARMVDSSSVEKLSEEFKVIARELGLNLKDVAFSHDSGSKGGSPSQALVKQVYKELSSMGSWLLIFDNVERKEKVAAYLPDHINKGQHVIVVSRYSVRGDEIGGAVVTVGEFSREEAARYIKSHLPQAREEEALELAKLMKCLPVDLKGAVSYIRNANISVREYIKTAQQSRVKLVLEEDIKRGSVAGNQVVSTTTTTTTSSKGLSAIATHHTATKAWDSLLTSIREEVSRGQLAPAKVFISYMPEVGSDAKSQDSNKEVEKRIERLISDLKQVGMEVYYEKDIAHNPAARRKQIQASNVLIPIATPAYKKLIEDKAPHLLQEEYKALLARAKDVPHGMLPMCLFGSRREAVPTGMGDYLVRALTEKTYENDLAAPQNPLGLIPAAYQMNTSEGSVYHRVAGTWRLSKLTSIAPSNPNFTGREEMLHEIAKGLESNKEQAISAQKVISGAGGIGKSSLALAYAHKYMDKYNMVRWLSSEGSNLRQEFASLGEELGLDIKGLEEKDLISLVYKRLSILPTYLLVFDNADSQEAIRRYLPKEAKQGHHILITSRDQNWKHKLSLGTFNEKEAVDYIKKLLPQVREEEARKLASELGYLPLALRQAVSYIEDTKTPIEDYLKSYEGVIQKAGDIGDREEEYPESIATTWALSMEQVKARSALAARMLTASAYLNPDNIPIELFKHKGLVGDPVEVHKALQILRTYSLIESSKLEDHVQMHRLVQAVTRQKAKEASGKEEENLELMLSLKHVLEGSLEGEKIKSVDFEKANVLLPHVEAVATHLEAYKGLEEDIAKRAILAQMELYDLAARNYFELGLYASSKEQYEKVLAIEEQAQGNDSPTVARTLSRLGDSLMMLGDYNKQKTLLERSVKINEVNEVTTAPLDLARDFTSLGLAHYQLGDHHHAWGNLQKALKVVYEKGYYTAGNPQAASTIEALGSLFGSIGDGVSKQLLLEEALRIKESYYGKKHPQVADILEKLGSIEGNGGSLPKQKELLDKALEIKQSYYGARHAQIAGTMESLSKVVGRMGKAEEEERLLKEAFEIKKGYYGESHPEIAFNLYLQSCRYEKLNENSKALELARIAYRILTASNYLNESLVRAYLAKIHEIEGKIPGLREKNAALLQAAIQGDLQEVAKLLAQGADIEALDKEGYTALILAVLSNQVEVTKTLIEHGADMNTKDNDGNTALLLAAGNNYLEIAKTLIEYGADIHAKTNDGKTALMGVVFLGDIALFKTLIEHGADIHAKTNDGNTALINATIHCQVEIAKALIDKGADVKAKTNDGNTALMWAAYQGQVEVAKALVDKGADINAKSKDGDTALINAARSGQVEIAKVLIDKGADINAKNNDGKTALIWAVRSGYVEIAQTLIDKGADIHAKNNDDNTALMVAYNKDLIALLKSKGAINEDLEKNDLTVKRKLELKDRVSDKEVIKPRIMIDKKAITPPDKSVTAIIEFIATSNTKGAELLLSLAERKGSLEIAKTLLLAGVDINATDNGGDTALMVAAEKGYVEVAKTLIEHGADINATDNGGDTALMLAVVSESTKLAQALIAAGANMNAKDNEGYTALMYAAWEGHGELVEYILTKGGNLKDISNDGKTSLHLAAANGKIDSVDLILNKAVTLIDEKDNSGDTPLHRAANNGELGSVKLLTGKGADIHIKNNNGQTALELAKSNGKEEVVKYLEAQNKE